MIAFINNEHFLTPVTSRGLGIALVNARLVLLFTDLPDSRVPLVPTVSNTMMNR